MGRCVSVCPPPFFVRSHHTCAGERKYAVYRDSTPHGSLLRMAEAWVSVHAHAHSTTRMDTLLYTLLVQQQAGSERGFGNSRRVPWAVRRPSELYSGPQSDSTDIVVVTTGARRSVSRR